MKENLGPSASSSGEPVLPHLFEEVECNTFPTEIRQHYAESFHRPVLVEYMSKPHDLIVKMTAMIQGTIINYYIQSPPGNNLVKSKKPYFLVRFARLPPPWIF